jgi:hypothetical protein
LRLKPVLAVLLTALVLSFAPRTFAQESTVPSDGPMMGQTHPAPVVRETPPAAEAPPMQDPMPPPARYDKAIFQKPIAPGQLAFLKQSMTARRLAISITTNSFAT